MADVNETALNAPLVRGLRFRDAFSIIVGGVIGTGIFLKTPTMAQDLGDPMWVMAAWVAAGLLSLAGALTYAELGAMFPDAGGEYVYLRKAYGTAPAFLWGWMHMTTGSVASAAAIAAGFGIFLNDLVPLGEPWATSTFRLLGQDVAWQLGWQQIAAVGAVIFFSVLNMFSVAFGGRVQTGITVLKLIAVAGIAGGVFLFAQDTSWSHLQAPAGMGGFAGAGAFGAAMLSALWAYDGWYGLPMVAGEVQNPGRNVPRSLITGLLCVIAVYLALNAAYFYALPFDAVATANSTAYPDAPPVAGRAVESFLGPIGVTVVGIIFIVSTLGALNAILLSGGRVSYALARGGLFFPGLGKVSDRGRVPVRALTFQCVVACLIALSGTFDQITTVSVFALWLFYGITAASVFIFRLKLPDHPRPYRTFGYPVVPALLVVVAAWLVVNTIMESPVESTAGLVLIALGLPFYFYFRRGQAERVGA